MPLSPKCISDNGTGRHLLNNEQSFGDCVCLNILNLKSGVRGETLGKLEFIIMYSNQNF